MSKVTFNGATRLININIGEISIDVKVDLYSEWKNWVISSDNAKYEPAFRTFGGDPTSTDQFAPQYFFLINDWKVNINNGETVSVGINLYSDDGLSPYIVGLGSGVSDRNSDAVIVDSSTEETLEYDGVVIINAHIGKPGTEYPSGTYSNPVDNWADAIAICEDKGFYLIKVHGLTVLSQALEGYTVQGAGVHDTIIFNNVNLDSTTFERVNLAGVCQGNIATLECIIADGFRFVSGIIRECGIVGDIHLEAGGNCGFFTCSSANSDSKIPTIIATSGAYFNVKRWSGDLNIADMELPSSDGVVELNGGTLTINDTCSDGTISLRGMANLVDNSTGTIVNKEALFIPSCYAHSKGFV